MPLSIVFVPLINDLKLTSLVVYGIPSVGYP